MPLGQIRRVAPHFIPRSPMTGLARECPRSQQPYLVVGSESEKIFTKLFLAFRVNEHQRIRKPALKFSRLHGEQEVQEAIDQGFLRTWSVSGGNYYLTQCDQSFILMTIEESGFPIGIGQERGPVFAFSSRGQARRDRLGD